MDQENKTLVDTQVVDTKAADVVEERLTVEIPTEIQAGAFAAAWGCDYAA
jgi:hypothetical protein